MIGRWALVVGASRGLGLGLAAELKSRGWNVVGTVRDAAGERRLEKLANKPGGDIRTEHLDINDDTQIAALRRHLDGFEFDLVFVNAGISPQGRAMPPVPVAMRPLRSSVAPMRVAH